MLFVLLVRSASGRVVLMSLSSAHMSIKIDAATLTLRTFKFHSNTACAVLPVPTDQFCALAPNDTQSLLLGVRLHRDRWQKHHRESRQLHLAQRSVSKQQPAIVTQRALSVVFSMFCCSPPTLHACRRRQGRGRARGQAEPAAVFAATGVERGAI